MSHNAALRLLRGLSTQLQQSRKELKKAKAQHWGPAEPNTREGREEFRLYSMCRRDLQRLNRYQRTLDNLIKHLKADNRGKPAR